MLILCILSHWIGAVARHKWSFMVLYPSRSFFPVAAKFTNFFHDEDFESSGFSDLMFVKISFAASGCRSSRNSILPPRYLPGYAFCRSDA